MSKEELALELTTVKQKYSVGEPIVIGVSLFNSGEEMITVNARMAVSRGTPGEITIDVTGPTGKKIPFSARVNVGKPDAKYFLNVAPSGSVGREIELNGYYALQQKGTYVLKAHYTNKWDGQEFGVDAWTGSLESSKAEFEIVK
jgi:hypothetical protein